MSLLAIISYRNPHKKINNKNEKNGGEALKEWAHWHWRVNRGSGDYTATWDHKMGLDFNVSNLHKTKKDWLIDWPWNENWKWQCKGACMYECWAGRDIKEVRLPFADSFGLGPPPIPSLIHVPSLPFLLFPQTPYFSLFIFLIKNHIRFFKIKLITLNKLKYEI